MLLIVIIFTVVLQIHNFISYTLAESFLYTKCVNYLIDYR